MRTTIVKATGTTKSTRQTSAESLCAEVGGVQREATLSARPRLQALQL